MIKTFSKNDQKKDGLEGFKRGFKSKENRDRRLKAFSTGPSVLSYILFMFSLGFGALSVPLGSLLRPLEALLGGLWTQKRVKTKCFLMVLKRLFLGL